MAEIQFNVNMDLVDKYVPAEDITIPQEDNLSVKFTYSIFNREVAENLTGATNIVVSYIKPDGHIVLQSNGTLELPNKVSIVANAQAFTYVGKVYMQVQYKKGTQTFNTRQAFFWVEKSGTSCTTVASSDFAPYLDNVIATGEMLNGIDLQALIDSKQTAENAQADVDALTPRVTTLETDVSSLKSRVTAVETKNTQQDTRLTSLENQQGTFATSISNLQASDTAQNTRLTNLESGQTTQDNKIAAIETKNATQDTSIGNNAAAISVLQTSQTAQDTKIANLEAYQTSSNTRITAVETKNTQQDTRMTNIESANSTQDTRLTA
ncbi:BppU family phage baseplate upper protein, partial [Bacillus cereus]|uniref:BppU family phage baseplate upper protein n=1 Tax=Bacillus cereus TaxID=1396 RepID=UPI000C004E1C